MEETYSLHLITFFLGRALNENGNDVFDEVGFL
jgi:hypothetical protein